MVLLVTILGTTPSKAWDCTLKKNQQSTNPKGECYVPPKPPAMPSAPVSSASAAQQQTQGQHQGQGQTANGGAATVGDTSSLSNAQASGAASLDASSSNSGNFNYPAVANPVNLPPIFVSGCGSGFGAGASAIRGSALFDYTHITKKCWEMLAAYGMLSAGYSQNACEIYKATDAGREAESNGARLDCSPPPPKVVYVDRPSVEVHHPEYATHEEVDRAFRQAVRK